MRRARFGAVVVVGTILAAIAAAPAMAQAPSPADMGRSVEAFVEAAIAFTQGVHLDESRLQTILDNMESLNQVGDDQKGEEIAKRALHDGKVDFDVVVNDPEYVAWCAAHGQSPRDFFKGLIRLQTLIMRESVQTNVTQMKARMPEQRKQLEQMRSSMGEDAYKKAAAMFDSSMAELDGMVALVQRVAPPSAEEASLMTKYRDQIKTALGDDDSEIERY